MIGDSNRNAHGGCAAYGGCGALRVRRRSASTGRPIGYNSPITQVEQNRKWAFSPENAF
jgi:hypothetical protein